MLDGVVHQLVSFRRGLFQEGSEKLVGGDIQDLEDMQKASDSDL